MNKIFNYATSHIIISRFNEPTDWIYKLNKFKNLSIYEKEKPEKGLLNIPINKGNEASAYLKYIIDNYNNLPNHLVFIHCHDYSWHHDDSIIDIIDSYIGKELEYQNINSSSKCGNLGNYQDWEEGELGNFYQNLIKPAVGSNKIYGIFTNVNVGCAQFIIHRDRITNHTLQFYQDIYNWILNIDINYYNHGFYLEWTWELFWNRWLINTPIKIYENEYILFAFQLNEKYIYIKDITTEAINELKLNNYYKITDHVKIITINKYNKINETISQNYIFNKFK